jgi:hypothetical protein
MCQEPSCRGALRLTTRHFIIGLAYLVVLSGAINPVLERTGQSGTHGALVAKLLLSPCLLALLVLVIDRAGPVKNWAVLFLLVLMYPALALYHDLTALIDYVANGRSPTLWATLVLNATLLPASVLYGGKMMPRSCPGCRRRTLIPLMQLFKKDKRTANTRWCASCGGKYWKGQDGNWHVEKRRTWLDAQDEARGQVGIEAPPDRHTVSEGRRTVPSQAKR